MSQSVTGGDLRFREDLSKSPCTGRDAPDAAAQRDFKEVWRHSGRKTKQTGLADETDAGSAEAGAPSWFALGQTLALSRKSAEGDSGLRPLAGARAAMHAAAPFATGDAITTGAQPALALNGQDLSGRIVTGPWAGLELQLSMHAGIATLVLRPASRQQLERLEKARDTFMAAAGANDADSGIDVWSFPIKMEIVRDDRMD